jgi:hypothetical protein
VPPALKIAALELGAVTVTASAVLVAGGASPLTTTV